VTSRTSLVVDVQIACDDSLIPAAREIESWVTRAVVESGESFVGQAELSVRVVDRDEIRLLNRDYRQKDSVTNVLSFPAGAIEGLPTDAVQALGDIVVCAAFVSDEAVEQGKSIDHHWAHMLVHGTLHLLGYDHETDAGAAEMEGLEARILTINGLADTYIESR
jgi:probable rRNA maturation factor